MYELENSNGYKNLFQKANIKGDCHQIIFKTQV